MTGRPGLAERLPLAIESGLEMPPGMLVLQPAEPLSLAALMRENVRVVHPLKTQHDAFEQAGIATAPEAEGSAEAVIVCLPRAKSEAFAMIADAAGRSRGLVLVDGQKTDGVDSVLKAVRQRVPVGGVISKAHGKIFWFAGTDAFEDWVQGPALTSGGFWTAPGVFSADGIDEGSALLVEALPALSGKVADLGAGWGYLSAHVLAHPDVTEMHLVEAHHMALQCAEHNVTDPRARFYWADALTWRPSDPMDAIVMNPPFHKGRQGDPALGAGFIAAAAKALKAKGKLYMVANRHLPYEAALDQAFRKVVDLGGNSRFKLVLAEVPRRS